ncbi:MAG: DoxX family protein [Oligoflexales bacterium]
MSLKKIISFVVSGEEFNSKISNLTLLLGRLGIGGMMAFAHGIGKIPPSEGFVQAVGALGFPLPSLFAFAAGLAEFIGAFFVAIGLSTRFSSIFVCITMFVAAFGRHFADPFAKKELALVYFFSFLVLASTGAGKLSLDYLIKKKMSL